MQVNFGRAYVQYNSSNESLLQNIVSDYIIEEFTKQPAVKSKKRINQISAEELLSDIKGMDVVVINDKNGRIKVEVQKKPPIDIFGSNIKPFVPYERTGNKKLRLNIDLNKSINDLPNKINKFINNCRLYAISKKSEKNIKAENQYMDKFDKNVEKQINRLDKLGILYDIID